MPEILDLYDRNGVRTGETMIRGTKVPAGRRVLIVSIVTLNSSGEILLTRRAEGKTYAGCWEITGGCVQSGETAAQGAVRELFEETGIQVTESELELRGTASGADYIHAFYLVRKDVPVGGLHLLAGETDAAKWAKPSEYLEMAAVRKTIPLHISLLTERYPDLFKE